MPGVCALTAFLYETYIQDTHHANEAVVLNS